MQKVVTYLTFKSGGKKAVDFYCSVFKDSTVDHCMLMPGTDQLLHAGFTLGGQEFMAMDGGDMANFSFTDGISLFVWCETQEEIDYYWDALKAEGGSEGQCGWLKDQFGVSWQIVPHQLGDLMQNSNPAVPGKVMGALMQMKKIIIADLETAAQN